VPSEKLAIVAEAYALKPVFQPATYLRARFFPWHSLICAVACNRKKGAPVTFGQISYSCVYLELDAFAKFEKNSLI
jgi:hypothetical protein